MAELNLSGLKIGGLSSVGEENETQQEPEEPVQGLSVNIGLHDEDAPASEKEPEAFSIKEDAGADPGIMNPSLEVDFGSMDIEQEIGPTIVIEDFPEIGDLDEDAKEETFSLGQNLLKIEKPVEIQKDETPSETGKPKEEESDDNVEFFPSFNPLEEFGNLEGISRVKIDPEIAKVIPEVDFLKPTVDDVNNILEAKAKKEKELEYIVQEAPKEAPLDINDDSLIMGEHELEIIEIPQEPEEIQEPTASAEETDPQDEAQQDQMEEDPAPDQEEQSEEPPAAEESESTEPQETQQAEPPSVEEIKNKLTSERKPGGLHSFFKKKQVLIGIGALLFMSAVGVWIFRNDGSARDTVAIDVTGPGHSGSGQTASTGAVSVSKYAEGVDYFIIKGSAGRVKNKNRKKRPVIATGSTIAGTGTEVGTGTVRTTATGATATGMTMSGTGTATSTGSVIVATGTITQTGTVVSTGSEISPRR